MARRGLFAGLVASLALSACAGGGGSGGMAADSATMQADIEAVGHVRDAFTAAFRAGDGAAIAALYTSDGLSQPNMQPTGTGTDGITAGFKGLFDQYTIADATITGVKTEVSGNLGYDIGTFRFTGVPKAKGDTLKSEGRYVVVLRKQADGTWKLVADMDNTSAPVAPPRPPGKM